MPERHDHDRFLARTETAALIDMAARVAGFDLGKRPEYATSANVSGVRNRTFTFSQRRDSRTIFATDARYGVLGKAGAWRGGDREPIAACRRVLKAAGVPPKEVSGIEVLSELGAAGQQLDGEVRIEEPELLRKIAAAHRAIEELPVWASHGRVGLTADGLLGTVELHWPAIPPEVVKEATVLRQGLDRGFQAPEIPGARPRRLEAGILHSPAIAFFMDVVAAVRVVYEPDEPELGRLATLYLDRHGGLVALPRDIKVVRPDQGERKGPG